MLSATQIDAVARRAVRLVESFPSRENPGIGKRALLLWEVRPAALALTAASPLRRAAASALRVSLRSSLWRGWLRLRDHRSRHGKHRDG